MGLEKTYDFFDTIAKQKIWEFLRENQGKKFSTLDISKQLDMPQSTVNRALNELEELGLLKSETEGKFKFFEPEKKVLEDMNYVFDHLDSLRRFTLEQRKKRGVGKNDNKDSRASVDK